MADRDMQREAGGGTKGDPKVGTEETKQAPIKNMLTTLWLSLLSISGVYLFFHFAK